MLIFAEKKADVDAIHEYLLLKGVEAVAIHGGKGMQSLESKYFTEIIVTVPVHYVHLASTRLEPFSFRAALILYGNFNKLLETFLKDFGPH